MDQNEGGNSHNDVNRYSNSNVSSNQDDEIVQIGNRRVPKKLKKLAKNYKPIVDIDPGELFQMYDSDCSFAHTAMFKPSLKKVKSKRKSKENHEFIPSHKFASYISDNEDSSFLYKGTGTLKFGKSKKVDKDQPEPTTPPSLPAPKTMVVKDSI